MADDWYDVINTWGPSDDFCLGLALSAASVLDVRFATCRRGQSREAPDPG